MAKVTGLPPGICKVMLSGLSRNNIIDIRGYNKVPKQFPNSSQYVHGESSPTTDES
jgi:hypothetical protein